MILAVLILVFLTAVFIGIPLVWAILLGTLVPMLMLGQTYPLAAVFLNFTGGIEPNAYMAIPLFIVAGELISRGGLGTRIIRFAKVLLGFMPGGLGVCVVATSMIFGGISGSAIADTAAIGSVMIPNMAEDGYNKSFAAALVAAAGTIGVIIPPSIPMLVYGFVGNVSVAELFISGIVPGVLFAISMMAICIWVGKVSGCDVGGTRPSLAEVWAGFVGCAPALLMPVIILGGIFSGIFTPTEAAAVAAVYGLVVAVGFYRDFSWTNLPRLIINSFLISAVVMVVIGATAVLSWFVTVEQIPALLVHVVKALSTSRWVYLLLVNIVLLILGHVIEPVPAILLTAPLFIPTTQAFGIDPVHFGLIMTYNLAIGLFTPPVGVTLFVASRISNVSVLSITRAVVPFFLISLLTLGIVTYTAVIPMGLVWLFRSY